MVFFVELRNAFQHHQNDTHQDYKNEYKIEPFTRRGICLVNNLVEFMPPVFLDNRVFQIRVLEFNCLEDRFFIQVIDHHLQGPFGVRYGCQEVF